MPPDLPEALRARIDTDTSSWQPRLFDLEAPADRDALAALLEAEPGLLVSDEIATQVAGLLETRDPAGTLDADQLREAVRARLGDAPERYGRWVHYPWSRRLVHVLPENEYRELRTSRNRNKITADEQETLRRLRIGIVGLSIGQAAAVTLTLEEVGGFLALADFDHLELSNMNRLRTSVYGLGVNKAVLAAREVYEINPYACVEVWTEGITDANLDAFLTTGGRPLDLVYEECDDLRVKVAVRERARAHRIPVLMETSDRGLMDIERFDLEPDRPLFHGLAGDVRAADLGEMTTYEKVPLVMRIIGRRDMSERMAASMVDVEATLKSWPQTASEVALGAGINVDTARRIALGQLTTSGRFYVDVGSIISDEEATEVETPESYEIAVSEEAQRFDLPPLRTVHEALTDDDARTLVAWAATAFSGGNCQPWRFTWTPGRLVLWHDRERSHSFLDVDDRASHLAFGSVIENLDLVCRAMRVHAEFRLFPDPADPLRICDVLLQTGAPLPVDELVHHVGSRVTNRRLGTRRPLDPTHRAHMDDEASAHGCRVQWLTDPASQDAISRILGRVDRVRMLSKTMHGDMMSELRWSLEEVERTRDGLDIATLELTPADLAGNAHDQLLAGDAHGRYRGRRARPGASHPQGHRGVRRRRAAHRGRPGPDQLRARGGARLHRVWTRANADGVGVPADDHHHLPVPSPGPRGGTRLPRVRARAADRAPRRLPRPVRGSRWPRRAHALPRGLHRPADRPLAAEGGGRDLELQRVARARMNVTSSW